MKTLTRIAVTVISLLIFVTACHDSVQEPKKATLNFSLTSPPGPNGGRVNEAVIPTAAIISIHDANGAMVEAHLKIKLSAFGQSYVSEPVIIDLDSDQNFFLSEFLILDANDAVLYATPKEGSDLAKFVSDPLDIEFSVTSNQTATVTPEVLAVDNTSPGDFGYAEFAFKIVDKDQTPVDIYVAGGGPSASHNYAAAYYKNGEMILLDKDAQSIATGIAVHNNDVYTVGGRTFDRQGYFNLQACYWKNTERIDFDFYGQTCRVISSGDDIYIAGYSATGPHYNDTQTGFFMKNGVKTNVPPLTPGASVQINDMYVDGNDVYLVGSEIEKPSIFNTYVKNNLFWKNTQVTKLPVDFIPTGVAVKNGHVHLCGNVIGKGSYMKDGGPVVTYDKMNARDIFVTDNEDVYMLSSAGYYWKNGEEVQLSNASTLPQNSFAFRMFEDKLYVVGAGYNKRDQPGRKYTVINWRDNVQTFGNPYGWGSAMEVVKR